MRLDLTRVERLIHNEGTLSALRQRHFIHTARNQAFVVVLVHLEAGKLLPGCHAFHRSIQKVTAHIELAPHTFGLCIPARIAIRLEQTVNDRCSFFFLAGLGIHLFSPNGARTRFIVIVHEVELSAIAAITAIGGSPIVEHIIAEIHFLCFCIVREP